MRNSYISPWDIAAIGSMRNLVLHWHQFDPIAVDDQERDYRLATAIWQYGYSWTKLCLAVHQEISRLKAQRPDRLLDRPDTIQPIEGKFDLEAWQDFETILLSLSESFKTLLQNMALQRKLDAKLAARNRRELKRCQKRDARFSAIFAARYPESLAA